MGFVYLKMFCFIGEVSSVVSAEIRGEKRRVLEGFEIGRTDSELL